MEKDGELVKIHGTFYLAVIWPEYWIRGGVYRRVYFYRTDKVCYYDNRFRKECRNAFHYKKAGAHDPRKVELLPITTSNSKELSLTYI